MTPSENSHRDRASDAATETLRGTAVSIDGRAVLITGSSGSGKSALALQLIALGAELVGDDLVSARISTDDTVFLSTLPDRQILIEARQVGLLSVPVAAPAPVALVVDMECFETERLPKERSCEILGVSIRLIRRVDGPHFAASVLLALKGALLP